MSSIKISIIIPIYNVEKYLQKCLESILNQEYKNIEVLLVNDGSTDSSGEIISKYADVDSRIKVINQDNGGLSVARNSGIKEATGYYIWFVDGDDWIAEGAINYLVEKIQEDEYDLISFSYVEYQEEQNVFSKSKNVQLIEAKSGIDFIAQSNHFFTGAWCYLYKSVFILSNELVFKPNQIHEDDYFNLECFGRVGKICKLPQALYYYRIRANSLTTAVSSSALKNRINSYLALIDLCNTISDLEVHFLKKKSQDYKNITVKLLDHYCGVETSRNEKIELINKVKKEMHSVVITSKDRKASKIWTLKMNAFNCSSLLFFIVEELSKVYYSIIKK
jgi:glycosyltransferase involved in cell wall biosynthesis